MCKDLLTCETPIILKGEYCEVFVSLGFLFAAVIVTERTANGRHKQEMCVCHPLIGHAVGFASQ